MLQTKLVQSEELSAQLPEQESYIEPLHRPVEGQYWHAVVIQPVVSECCTHEPQLLLSAPGPKEAQCQPRLAVGPDPGVASRRGPRAGRAVAGGRVGAGVQPEQSGATAAVALRARTRQARSILFPCCRCVKCLCCMVAEPTATKTREAKAVSPATLCCTVVV